MILKLLSMPQRNHSTFVLSIIPKIKVKGKNVYQRGPPASRRDNLIIQTEVSFVVFPPFFTYFKMCVLQARITFCGSVYSGRKSNDINLCGTLTNTWNTNLWYYPFSFFFTRVCVCVYGTEIEKRDVCITSSIHISQSYKKIARDWGNFSDAQN